MKEKEDEVTMKISTLEKIAEIYEFPVAAFFEPDSFLDDFRKRFGTRCEELRQKAEKYDDLVESLEE